MPNLALILFAPWFAILAWAYWQYPKSHLRSAGRRRFDLLVLVLALALSIIAMRWSYFLPFKGVGVMWPQVIATLAAYHTFTLVLVLGWFLRSRFFRAPGA
jgi:hypothetical protein